MRIYDFSDVPLSDTELMIALKNQIHYIDFSCNCGVLSANRLAVGFFSLQNRQRRKDGRNFIFSSGGRRVKIKS